MKRRHLTAALLVAAVPPGLRAAPSETEAAAGVRAALERGALAAVQLLGRSDGFLGNPQVRIPLPEHLERVAKLLKATGQGQRVDELVTAMNRAAEAAVPEARTLFVSTVKQMSVEDALQLVRGSPTAVTEYFAAKTRTPLGEKFLPIVTRATQKVKLAERYNQVAARAAGAGLLKGEAVTVQQHVTARALDGLFLVIGEEEKKMRADPVKTGSALLKRVFGG
jgi:hypothetical protein